MKNLLVGAVFFLVGILATISFPGKTFASGNEIYGGIPVYGGGFMVPGQVLIDKTVLNPASGIFVDNLGPNDPKYRPEQIITFHIVVKNSGEQPLSTVTVTDKLPQFVEFVAGPGTYDAQKRTLTFVASNVIGGTPQLFEVKLRALHVSLLPEGKNVICPVNIVDGLSDTQIDHDEAQFCVEKEMVVPVVPKAGPEHGITFLAILLATLTTGTYLRKKAVIS